MYMDEWLKMNFVTTKYPHFNPNSFFVPIFLVTLYPNAIKNE